MFGEVFERFIQNRPVAVMVRVLQESFLNADRLDRWFDTVRQTQYTKEILFSSIVGLMLRVVCHIRPSVHSAYRHSDIQASVVALYGKLQKLEPTTSQGLVRYIAGEAEALIHQYRPDPRAPVRPAAPAQARLQTGAQTPDPRHRATQRPLAFRARPERARELTECAGFSA